MIGKLLSLDYSSTRKASDIMPVSDTESDKALRAKFLNTLRQVVHRSQQENKDIQPKTHLETSEKALDTLKQKIQSAIEQEKLSAESAEQLARTIEKIQASLDSVLPNLPPQTQSHLSETLDQLNQLLQELSVVLPPVTIETRQPEIESDPSALDTTAPISEGSETDPSSASASEMVFQSMYDYLQSVFNQYPAIVHELSINDNSQSNSFLSELLENTSQASGTPAQLAALFASQEQQHIKNVLEQLPPNIRSLLTEIAKTLPSGGNARQIDLSSLSPQSEALLNSSHPLSQDMLKLLGRLSPTTVETLQTQLPNPTSPAQTSFASETNSANSIDSLAQISTNLGDSSIAPTQQSTVEPSLQKLMENLNATLNRLSLSEQETLKDALTQLAHIQSKATEKPLNKSIQQIQLELSFKHSASKPQAYADILGEQNATEGSPFEIPLSSLDTSFGTAVTSVQTDSQTSLNQSFQQPSDTAMYAIDTGFNIAVQRTDSSPPPFQAHLNDNAKPVHEQVLDAAQMTLEAGKKEISLNLKPAELGSVKLILTSNMQNEVSAKLITSTPDAKALLEKSLQQLTQALKEQGVQIGTINVINAGSDPNSAQNNTDQQPQSQTSWTGQQDQSNFNQQPHQQQFNHVFQDLGYNAFKDGGTSRARDEASSQSSSDTDVGGEEVFSQSETGQNDSAILSQQTVDIRI